MVVKGLEVTLVGLLDRSLVCQLESLMERGLIILHRRFHGGHGAW